ncbi:PQQ-dependent sugar dehydrogenase [Dyadobacter sediminis]|uniref:PQQ-dependent sugar dehydrogenase n=1 Tax=Dyadobacter sediminis TaxID=1493691 RepID=A0A5R9KKC6_9BACT|nr:PQQ-dependent sugar dehydrogenase [Dyadobacter sediminis]TLU96634.1 PQQ-dependent sugar dehydrogenase [Dyadobacter sediminis]GGB83911.1 glucose dehydrogenase [Dyadobacter sediminis]
MYRKIIAPLLSLLVFTTSVYAQTGPAAPDVSLKLISDALTHPTAFAVTKKNPELLFVCEQEGRIRIIQNEKLVKTPFLDITDDVLKKEGYDERGLLGLAFHPDYASNGKFYVYISVAANGEKGVDHHSEIREYKVSKSNAMVAEKSAMRKVLTFNQPESNHNGGDLKFGADGYLYISSGDGGGGGDRHGEHGNGQNINTLLGKILRIDINQTPYGIPKDNPFVNRKDARPEIFAYGLRNPWRISFDRQTHQLFAGEVGQDKYEEVDIITNGGNYGWRAIEGFHPFKPSDPQPSKAIKPIYEYPHTEGISITGGFVYRGKAIPALAGKYVYGDMMGPIWALAPQSGNKWTRTKLSVSRDPGYWHVYSFGEDVSGEMYVLTQLLQEGKGAVYKFVQQ